MTSTETLQQILAQYEEKLSKVRAAAGAFAGAFGMGDDPRNNACNQVFYENVEQWAADTVASAPSSAEAYAAVELLLRAAHDRAGEDTYWYAYAAQKHAAGLIDLLTPQDAARLREDYIRCYPRQDWLPVQRDIYARLTKAAGAAASGDAPAADKIRQLLMRWGRRVILLLIGLTIAHLGVTLFLLADLGSDPFNVMIQGLFRAIPWGAIPMTHGTVHVVISLLIILALLVIDRSYVRIGTFLCMILGGPIIDVFTVLLGSAVNSGSPMAVRILAVILGCGILAFGMTIVIKSEAGTGPNDLVAVVTSDKTGKKFGIIRIAVDIGFALIGFLLGGTVGVGTVICLAVVGPVAQVFMPFSQRLCSRFLKTDNQ